MSNTGGGADFGCGNAKGGKAAPAGGGGGGCDCGCGNPKGGKAATTGGGGGGKTVVIEAGKPQPVKPQPHPVMETLCGIQYCVNTHPSWVESTLLGFEHSLLTLGTFTLIASLIVPHMGGGNYEKARVIQSMLFASSINTLLQTLVGTRLPVVMGGSHAFVIPSTAIAFAAKLTCTDPIQLPQQRFERTMVGIQGALLVASVFQIILGFSGIWRNFVRFLCPLTMVPLITFTGLGLFNLGFPKLADCAEIAIPQIVLMIIFSQYISRLIKSTRLISERYALVISISITWFYALILTLSGLYQHKPKTTQLSCRTDRAGLITSAPWVYFPKPFQWGRPVVSSGEAAAMVFAGLVAVTESTGTFIAAARYASATPVPPSVISRGAFWLGVGTMINAICGAVTGPTSSVESAGLLGLTRVGSRRVVQISAGFTLLFSVFGKLGAFFASVPLPITVASNCILYAYVCSAGLNHLQFCNLNSFRTLFILGFSFFIAISIPQHFHYFQLGTDSSLIHTRSKWFNDSVTVMLVSSPVVAIIIAYVLDNTIECEEEGARKDSGKQWWERFVQFAKDLRSSEFYSLPCKLGDCFPSL